MAWTGYFRTEQIPSKMWPKGHTFVLTSINQPIQLIQRPSLFTLMVSTRHSSADAAQNIYLHDDAPTEPVGDGSITMLIYGGPAVEYSATGDPPGYIKSFTSEAGFFSVNQNFSDHNTLWTITYAGRYAGAPPPGSVPYIRFEFYKRSALNVDTLLFKTLDLPIGLIISETTRTFVPSGSVTVADRLRIRVYVSSKIPT